MIVSTHPLAADELVDAAVYYAREGSAELGNEVIAEFERCIALLRVHPRLGAAWRGKFRRLPLRRFPYNVVYVLNGDALRIVALAHQRRRPGYWRDRE